MSMFLISGFLHHHSHTVIRWHNNLCLPFLLKPNILAFWPKDWSVCWPHCILLPGESLWVYSHSMLHYTHTHTHARMHARTFYSSLTLSMITWVNQYQSKSAFYCSKTQWFAGHQLGHMQICILPQTDDHASTSPLSFLQAGCSSCHLANSIKALKALCYITHHNCYMIVSWTTQMSWYQKKHSPTHTHRDHQSSLICFLHLLWSMASSFFNLHAWQSFSTISVQVFFGLFLGPHCLHTSALLTNYQPSNVN